MVFISSVYLQNLIAGSYIFRLTGDSFLCNGLNRNLWVYRYSTICYWVSQNFLFSFPVFFLHFFQKLSSKEHPSSMSKDKTALSFFAFISGSTYVCGCARDSFCNYGCRGELRLEPMHGQGSGQAPIHYASSVTASTGSLLSSPTMATRDLLISNFVTSVCLWWYVLAVSQLCKSGGL